MNTSPNQANQPTYASLDEVAAAVADHQGVLTMSMWQLRDAHGAGRLGVHVRTGISSGLAERGVGHYPPDLPGDQLDQARLYKRGTPVAELIEAVMNWGEEEDEKLRSFAGGDAQKILNRVRELVCA